MTFNKVLEPKTDKNRLHLDVISHTLDAETERLLCLGARRLRDVEFDRRADSWPTSPSAKARWQRGTPAVTRPSSATAPSSALFTPNR
jgi:hypothetical protein